MFRDDGRICMLSRRLYFFDWERSCATLQEFQAHGLARRIAADDIRNGARPRVVGPGDVVLVTWGAESTEIEWEAAASGACAPSGHRGEASKHRYPWGDEAPDATRARLGAVQLGCAGVGAFARGDAPTGCRQMIGNVWEWTSSAFEPYPGFVRDAYAEYSEPWFGTHAVLRGGSFATRPSLIRTTWRNFYPPERRDVFAGFRTCALAP